MITISIPVLLLLLIVLILGVDIIGTMMKNKESFDGDEVNGNYSDSESESEGKGRPSFKSKLLAPKEGTNENMRMARDINANGQRDPRDPSFGQGKVKSEYTFTNLMLNGGGIESFDPNLPSETLMSDPKSLISGNVSKLKRYSTEESLDNEEHLIMQNPKLLGSIKEFFTGDTSDLDLSQIGKPGYDPGKLGSKEQIYLTDGTVRAKHFQKKFIKDGIQKQNFNTFLDRKN